MDIYSFFQSLVPLLLLQNTFIQFVQVTIRVMTEDDALSRLSRLSNGLFFSFQCAI